MPEQRILRWGILSTAEIAQKNWKAILNSGNGVVAAVASRDASRSRIFVDQCLREAPFAQAPVSLGSYDALLAAKDIDAVYIPLPTGLRKEWVIRAADAGKHIVCEKPCAPSVADLNEMLRACDRNHVQFMDGVMFMHSRRLEQVRTALDDGESVGDVRHIASGFSFRAPTEFFTDNIRAQSALEPLGCLGDLGWYCIRFTLWAMKFRYPRFASGRLLSKFTGAGNAEPVPTEFSGELFFDGGVSASYYCSFVTQLQQWAQVSGSKGSLRVADFVLPYRGSQLTFEINNPSYHIAGCDFRMEAGSRQVTVAESSDGHPSAQETNLFRNFAGQVLSGRLNDSWPEMALKTQHVMEACLESSRADGKLVSIRGV